MLRLNDSNNDVYMPLLKQWNKIKNSNMMEHVI